MGGFLSAIFGGQNKTLNKDINQFGQDAGVATTLGTGDATAASKEYQDILSGDPTKEAAAIAPETKAAQDQAAQAKKTTAEFSNRGGRHGRGHARNRRRDTGKSHSASWRFEDGRCEWCGQPWNIRAESFIAGQAGTGSGSAATVGK